MSTVMKTVVYGVGGPLIAVPDELHLTHNDRSKVEMWVDTPGD